jgi:hypothetical protein
MSSAQCQETAFVLLDPLVYWQASPMLDRLGLGKPFRWSFLASTSGKEPFENIFFSSGVWLAASRGIHRRLQSTLGPPNRCNRRQFRKFRFFSAILVG